MKLKIAFLLVLASCLTMVMATTPTPCSPDWDERASSLRLFYVGCVQPKLVPAVVVEAKIPVVDQLALTVIELLSGHTAALPVECSGATLVHGAVLWELGIIEQLYFCLVRKDGDNCLLGNLLLQFFNLNGATLAPVQHDSCLAQRLTIEDLAKLYCLVLNSQFTTRSKGDYNRLLKILAQGQNAKKTKVIEPLAKAIFGCSKIDVFNPQNLAPSIVMAFFWAKFLIGAESAAVAQFNFNQFIAKINSCSTGSDGADFSPSPSSSSGRSSDGSDSDFCLLSPSTSPTSSAMKELSDFPPGGGAGAGAFDSVCFSPVAFKPSMSSASYESIAIDILRFKYMQNIPVPPACGNVVLDGKKFPDCVESGLRALFNAAFFDKPAKGLLVPDKPGGFYSDALMEYVSRHATMADQNKNMARQEWAALLSKRPNIQYEQSDCEAIGSFENIASLLAQLVPGIYEELLQTCPCCSGYSSPEESLDHFVASQPCAKKMLQLFMNHHGLVVDITAAGNAFEVRKIVDGGAGSSLLFSIKDNVHLDYKLKVPAQDLSVVVEDPILSCMGALKTDFSMSADFVQPILFMAARMVQEKDFLSGYFGMISIGQDNVEIIKQNLIDHRLIAERSLSQLSQLLRAPLVAAARLGLKKACLFLLQKGASINQVDEFDQDNTALIAAAQKGHLGVVKLLCEHGANINLKNEHGKMAIHHAHSAGHEMIVHYLKDAITKRPIKSFGDFSSAV